MVVVFHAKNGSSIMNENGNNMIDTKNISQLKSLLQQSSKKSSEKAAIFFKTGPGQYAEHDQFIGVSVPTLRKIAKDFIGITRDEIQCLLQSKINEQRLLALIILVSQYKKTTLKHKEVIYQFYLNNLEYINNWNLVDASAHLIIGAHLQDKNRNPLLKLAKSEIMWERRISIVSTWEFIKNNDLEWTFKISTLLLNDTHDLIHKAVGWMLREAGKRDQKQLMNFLDQFSSKMPRTMLRYAIEKFSEPQRKHYLLKI